MTASNKFAATTSADSARTQSEIQATLMRFGADGFISGHQRLAGQSEAAMVAFQYMGKMIRLTMVLPRRDAPEFQQSPNGRVKFDVNRRFKEWDQACRAKWRALFLAIKAKLVSVEEGISTVEQEFMAWMILPNGKTAGDHFLPQIDEAAESGRMPRLPFNGGGQE